MKMEIDLSVCPTCYTGEVCSDPDCGKLHLTDYEIERRRVLEFFDIQYLKTEANSRNPVRMLSDRSEWPNDPPILCNICANPVESGNCVYFDCCECFVCKPCIETWEYGQHCPECGSDSSEIDPIPEELTNQIKDRNKAFRGHPIV